MCSIFGYVARKNSPVDLAVLRRIVGENIARGPHAFGFAWIDSRERLHCFKSPGRLTDHIRMLGIVRDARMLIGHLRYATHGDPADNSNNHPHPVDGGWLVHNGVVANYRDLLRGRSIFPVGDCDSEAIGHLIARSVKTGMTRRTVDAIEQTDGVLAILGLWTRPGRLIAARRGNPLHIGHTPRGVYLATMARGLPGIVRPLADHRAIEIDRSGATRRTVEIDGEPVFGSSLYDVATYRGG